MLLCPRFGGHSTLTPGTTVQVTSPHHIVVDGQRIEAALYKVPSHAYTGLVQASPEFTELSGVSDLFNLARCPNARPEQVRALLDEVAHRPAQLDPVPRLVQSSQQFSATWLPQQTLVKLTPSDDFFLVSAFKAHFTPLFQASRREPFAVDVGLYPLTMAKGLSGLKREFEYTELSLPSNTNGLDAAATRLYNRLIYVSGRRDCEQIIAYLVQNASEVISEYLRLDNMDRRYIAISRGRAIQDHHFAALPQLLNAARIRLVREPAGHTSTECPKCRHVSSDNRKGSQFRCRRCGYSDNSHVVACSNLHRRWQRRQRYSWF